MTEEETRQRALHVANMQEYNALRELEAETEKLMIRYRYEEAKRLYHETKRLAEKAEGSRKWWKETAAIDAAYLFGVACGGTFAWLFLRFFV